MTRHPYRLNASRSWVSGPMHALLRGGTLVLAIASAAEQLAAQTQWFKGNVHVHTINSDGSASPDAVARWYREHGYHFVVITDHDQRTPVEPLNAAYAAPGRFLVLAGVEVSDQVDGRPVHLNGIGVTEAISPQGGTAVATAIDRNARAIEAAGGLSVLNHPNGLLRSALTVGEITSSTTVEHFEVCCADYQGGSGHPSTDEIWDGVLSAGRRLFGVAADDAHQFDAESRDPGSAWVMVRATDLSVEALLAALRAGAFYATTGVVLRDVRVDDVQLCVDIAGTEDYGFRTVFVGNGGVELARDESASPCYRFDPEDAYVRARVHRSDGAIAWVQPVLLR